MNQGDGTFGDLFSFPLESSGLALNVLDDFNGDGITDFLVYSQPRDEVPPSCLYFVTPEGTVELGECFDLGPGLNAIGSGDVNEDGIADFFTDPGLGTTPSRLFLSDGLGSFSRLDNPVPSMMPTLLLDFDADGHLDLLGRGALSQFEVARGNGDGTFRPVETIDLPASSGNLHYRISFAELNGDGHLDAAVLNGLESEVRVFISNGDETFSEQQTIPVDENFFGLIDVNVDGILDFLTFPQFQSIHVMLGQGDGTFSEGLTTRISNFSSAYILLDGSIYTEDGIGQLDADGIPDILFGGAIYYGLGDGTFETRPFLETNLLETADLNGDGALDFVTTSSTPGAISVRLNNGDGTFEPEVSYPVEGGTREVIAEFINSDSHVDLTILNGGGRTISVLLGTGEGTFAPQRISLIDPFIRVQSLELHDLNGDGNRDGIGTGFNGFHLLILFGDGEGAFGPPVQLPFFYGVRSVAAEDVDDDGFSDLIVSQKTDLDLAIREDDLVLYRGTGTDFEYGGLLAASLSGNSKIVDLNEDGISDIVAVRPEDHLLVLLFGASDGTFGEEILLPTGDEPSDPHVADFDGDGRPDLATANWRSHNVSIYLNQGGGEFDQRPRIPASGAQIGSHIQAADMNNNGRLDLILAGDRVNFPNSSYRGTVQVMINAGGGDFVETDTYAQFGWPCSFDIIDINEDGLLDVVLDAIGFDGFRTELSIFLNRGDGSLDPPVNFAGSFVVFTGDLENDGDFDFVSRSLNASGIFLVFNRLEQIVP